MGPSWDPFGALLAPPGGSRGGSGRVLGRSWGPLRAALQRSCQKVPFGCDLQSAWTRLGPSWRHLGAVLGPSWAPVGPPWASLGVLLGPLEALLGPSWNHLRHLKQIKENTEKHQKTSIRIAFLGPRESQEKPKMSQSWIKLGSSWLPKGSKSQLGDISSHLETVVASKPESRREFEAI